MKMIATNDIRTNISMWTVLYREQMATSVTLNSITTAHPIVLTSELITNLLTDSDVSSDVILETKQLTIDQVHGFFKYIGANISADKLEVTNIIPEYSHTYNGKIHDLLAVQNYLGCSKVLGLLVSTYKATSLDCKVYSYEHYIFWRNCMFAAEERKKLKPQNLSRADCLVLCRHGYTYEGLWPHMSGHARFGFN